SCRGRWTREHAAHSGRNRRVAGSSKHRSYEPECIAAMIGASLYRSVVAVRNYCFDHEFLRARHLQWPVISVGNISVGGSGKTPFVIALGQLLRQRGIHIDVLSRGYRRSTSGVLNVQADGSPDQYGDEPLLIARRLGCPVIVG